jgi:aminoglycoside N3'-acetyltransferase
MVHASLRAVGPVEGGADGVIDALEAVVGPHGTVLMTLGAHAAEPFDCLVTPADPDVGILAEVFRTRRTTSVSDHPEGRFGASGRLATTLVKNVPWDDYYGPDSPLERFVHAGGRVLRLGAELDTLTVLHYAEYLAPIPAKRRVRRHCVVVGPAGPERRVVDCLDDSDGIVEHPGEDYFAVILRRYLAAGRATVGVVGGATSELIEAADVVEFAVEWMVENLTR